MLLSFGVTGAAQNSLAMANMSQEVGGVNSGGSGLIVRQAGELEVFTQSLAMGESWEQIRRRGGLPFLPNKLIDDLETEFEM